MREKIKTICLVSLIFYAGCEDSESSGGLNEAYIGKWTLSFSATYEGESCSGNPMGGRDGTVSNSTTSITLNADGSYLNSDAMMCAEPGNASDENCKGTWESSENKIKLTLSAFPISMEYNVSESEGISTMSLENLGESTSNGLTIGICQKTSYTKE